MVVCAGTMATTGTPFTYLMHLMRHSNANSSDLLICDSFSSFFSYSSSLGSTYSSGNV